MTPRSKKPILLAIPLVLLASGLAFAFIPGIEIPSIGPDNKFIQIETVSDVNLANGSVTIEAKSLKDEWFLNWELEEERDGLKFEKTSTLQYRVNVSAERYFEPVEFSVFTVDSTVRYTITLNWDENAHSISLDESNITF